MSTAQQRQAEHKVRKANAEVILKEARAVQRGLHDSLSAWAQYLDGLEEFINNPERNNDRNTYLSTPQFGYDLLQRMEDVLHVHTGGDTGMHARHVRQNIAEALAGEEIY